MIEPNLSGLSVSKQCALLSISRSSFYYEPKGESEMNLNLMRLIDTQFLETPFYGVRQMTWHLSNGDHLVNEKRIRRLMRLEPIYQKPNTSKAAKGHKVYPYLLRAPLLSSLSPLCLQPAGQLVSERIELALPRNLADRQLLSQSHTSDDVQNSHVYHSNVPHYAWR